MLNGWHVCPCTRGAPPPTDPVLLDGWRQAAALPSGDVVAVIGGNADVPSFFGCHQAQLRTNPWDIQRPVLAAVLQAGRAGFRGQRQCGR